MTTSPIVLKTFQAPCPWPEIRNWLMWRVFMHRTFSFPLLHCYSALDVYKCKCNTATNTKIIKIWVFRVDPIYCQYIDPAERVWYMTCRYIHKRVAALVWILLLKLVLLGDQYEVLKSPSILIYSRAERLFKLTAIARCFLPPSCRWQKVARRENTELSFQQQTQNCLLTSKHRIIFSTANTELSFQQQTSWKLH